MIKKILLILFCGIVGVTIVTSCTDDAPAEDPSNDLGEIYGIITDSKTAEPMRAIGVELYKYRADGYAVWALLRKTVTYDDGHFEFENIDPGRYLLEIKADGYNKESYYVIVEAGKIARADMQITQTPPQATGITVSTFAVGAPIDNIITFKGECTNNIGYGHAPTEVGFVYGQTQEIDINVDTKIKAELKGTFESQLNLTELENGTWYVKAYAKNAIGYEFGELRKFEVNLVTVVKTLDVTNIDGATATLNGLIVYEGKPKYTEKGFVYSSSYNMPTIDDPGNATSKVAVSGNSKEFGANISNLTEDKTYYVRAYAKYSDGIAYGDVISFVAEGYKPYVVIDKLAIQRSDLSASATWNQAKALCENSRIGGFSDWRLPTLGELSLMYENQDKIGGFIPENYWSNVFRSESYGYYYYYMFSFKTGKSDYCAGGASLRVRAVRTIK